MKPYDFNTYRDKFCSKFTSIEQARKMWNYYLETFEASTDMKDTMFATPTPATVAYSNLISFAPFQQVECTVPCKPALKCEPNKKEKTMYVDNDKHIESSKINYLNGRAEDIYYRKINEMQKTFGLVADEAPETATELVKRIQDGKFVIKDEYKEKRTYGDAARYITWRDPAIKEDKAGYHAAVKLLDVALQDARDTIAIGTPAEGLTAVKTLDAWTPTAK